MAKKQTPTTKGEQQHNPARLTVEARSPEEQRTALADKLLQPEVRAALAMQKFDDCLDVGALTAELKTQTAAMVSGDLSRAEAMLGAQAHTLDALFSNLARRAHHSMNAGYLDSSTAFLKLALKAQAQSVRTIEALGELKNPKQIAYVAQANISGGHQQVNNGHNPQAGRNQIEQNKLSAEGSYELLPNTRTQSIKGAVNPPMEAVGEVRRTSNSRRQSNSEQERI